MALDTVSSAPQTAGMAGIFRRSCFSLGKVKFPLAEASISDLQSLMASGKFSSESIVKLYIRRIAALDSGEGKLNSVLQINPDAVAIARALDRERKEKGVRGPMHGIPVLLKDNIDTADSMDTSAGSLALLGSKPVRDAFIVERLRSAGAVILGKANLSEWANFRSTKSSSGWSGRGGQTRNPYFLDRTPSGSSSGSAVAVSANLTAVSVGTETDGSILSPASMCGIVGMKPTIGLVSRSGIIPIAHSQDTAGPMARSVSDLALLLGAMTGADSSDPATMESSGIPGFKTFTDYASFLKPGGLRGAHIGIVRDPSFNFRPELEPVLTGVIEALKAEGTVVLDPVDLPHAAEIGEDEFTVLLHEFKADLEAYLAARPGAAVKTLDELIEFNKKNASREMPYFGQELIEKAASMGPLTEKAYRDALEGNQDRTRAKGIDAALAANGLDALLVLSNGPAPMIDLVNGDSIDSGSSAPAAVAGYPSITIPAGWYHGLPIGVSFIGTAWSEGRLINLAFALESALKARKAPRFLACSL